jgi:chromosome segregation ATPase
VQLTLARLNIEEQRIAQLSSQLEQVRRELSAVSLDMQGVTERVPELEKALLMATDEKVRKQLEVQHTETKRHLVAQSRLEQQLRARENEATQTINAEQARWTDLNARLDELERLLGPAPR